MAAKKKTAKKKVSKKKTAKKKVVAKKSTDNIAKPDPKMGTKLLSFLKLKAKISKANKVVNDLKAEASVLEKDLIIDFENSKTLRADVKLGSVSLKKEDVFSAKDWPKVWDYILKSKDTGLLQKRLSQALLKEYYEDGLVIKGIEHMTKKSLSVGFKRGV